MSNSCINTSTFSRLYLHDIELIAHCKNIGRSLPFSLSSLRKDRIDARLGGVPYRRIGGAVLYVADDVFSFLAGQPIIQPQRHPALAAAKPTIGMKAGRPRKEITVAAKRLGLSTREYLAQRQIEGGEP